MFMITPIVISCFISTVVLAINTSIAWRHRQERSGYYFSLFTASLAFWGVMVTLGYAAKPLSLKIFFAVLDAWGYRTAEAFLLLFALCFAGYEHIAEKKWMKAIAVLHVLSHALLASTNQWHGLIWKDFIPQANNVVLFVHGPAFALTVITGYSHALICMTLFVIASFRGSNIIKRQARLLITAFLIHIFLNVAYNIDLFDVPGVDWTSSTSAFTNVFVLWALSGQKLLDINPIARNKLINNLSDGLIALDLKNRIIDINRSAAGILGSAENALLGKNLEDVFPRLTLELMEAPEKEIKFELNIDDQRYYDALLSPIHDEWPKGQIGRMIILRDITERKQTELRLLQLHKAVEQSPVSVLITDIQGNIEYVNPHFTKLTGYELNEVIGKNPLIIQSGSTPRETYEEMWNTIRSGKVWRGDIWNKKKNGELYCELEIITPVIDGDGAIVNYVAIKEDITAQKEADAKLREAHNKLEEQMSEIQALQSDLREQAIRDPLTKLHNRHYLKETLNRELSRAMRERYPVSFLLLDIDHFKHVNDTYGHAAGDFVLRDLADHLAEFTRTGDIVCRYGGEEFLVVFPNTKEQDAFLIADRLRVSIQESLIYVDRHVISITVSAGISEFPTHGQYEALILESADKALYHAKYNGRNQVVLWSKIKAPF
ncbi:diguanylate cyclase [Candidatus Villigracilis affinis]|uniref:histidine kinase N-terminal 7TM domain-containing diguanylate cyclase n=1 Tax=Candidatus Villigracilis affinis TaxID=3140682 RepID=UPI002A1D74D2|nr:diguanylate cyclase [Anaerolineales bacterium]